MKLTFSGHESFQCRHFWLKKGFDFLSLGKKFSDNDAVVNLGVGKNMVVSIRYWMRAFDLVDSNDQPNDFCKLIFGNNGLDPFLEDEATLWLLHFNLIRKGSASSYAILFNEIRKQKIEFTREQFIGHIKKKLELVGGIFTRNTIEDDFNVLTKMYIRNELNPKEVEDSFSGLLCELDLLRSYGKKGEEVYYIENSDRNEIPSLVFLYCLLVANPDSASISLSKLENDDFNLGNIFAMNKVGITNKLESISKESKFAVFNDHAGLKELQFKKKLDPVQILRSYYEKK